MVVTVPDSDDRDVKVTNGDCELEGLVAAARYDDDPILAELSSASSLAPWARPATVTAQARAQAATPGRVTVGRGPGGKVSVINGTSESEVPSFLSSRPLQRVDSG